MSACPGIRWRKKSKLTFASSAPGSSSRAVWEGDVASDFWPLHMVGSGGRVACGS